MPNPFDAAADWANENIVEPVVDLVEDIGEDAEEFADEVSGLLSDVGTAIGQVAGDALRALGIDPDQLADEFNALSADALNAFLDFLNSIRLLMTKGAAMIGAMTALKNNSFTFAHGLTQARIQLAMQLRTAVSTVLEAIKAVGRALGFLIDLLPSFGLRQVVLNVNPQLAVWLNL